MYLSADAWKTRWLDSKHKADYGEWKLTAGNFYGDAEKDKGQFLIASWVADLTGSVSLLSPGSVLPTRVGVNSGSELKFLHWL